jgi:hypothetical protein
VVAKFAMNKGWLIEGEGKMALCPACLELKRSERRAKKLAKVATDNNVIHIEQEKAPSMDPISVIDNTPVLKERIAVVGESPAPSYTEVLMPTDKSREARRKAYGLLEDHFHIEKGMYLNDYSDERVASESGLSIAALVTLREAMFGPIKITAAVVALQEQAEEQHKHFLTEVDSLRKLITALVAQEDERYSKLRSDLNALKG